MDKKIKKILTVIFIVYCILYAMLYSIACDKVHSAVTEEKSEIEIFKEINQLKNSKKELEETIANDEEKVNTKIKEIQQAELDTINEKENLKKYEKNEIKKRTKDIEHSNLHYFEENEKFYIIKANQKVEIISPKKAEEIALNEAKVEKYQKKGSESDFIVDKKTDGTSAIYLKNINKYNTDYFWNDEWSQIKLTDANTYMWKVRLRDQKNEADRLYIYINAETGQIAGADDYKE